MIRVFIIVVLLAFMAGCASTLHKVNGVYFLGDAPVGYEVK